MLSLLYRVWRPSPQQQRQLWKRCGCTVQNGVVMASLVYPQNYSIIMLDGCMDDQAAKGGIIKYKTIWGTVFDEIF